jgi:hypothetical protein
MDTMTLAAVEVPRGEIVASVPRWHGAAIGCSIAFVAGLVGLGFEVPFLLLGIPAATVAGWFLGPRVAADGGVAGMAVAMAVVTISTADAMLVTALGLTSVGAGLVQGLATAMLAWALGMVFVGIPMLVITVPCGLVWAMLVRMLARRSR